MREGMGTTQPPVGATPRVDALGALGPQDLDAALEQEVLVLARATQGLGPSGLRVLTICLAGEVRRQ